MCINCYEKYSHSASNRGKKKDVKILRRYIRLSLMFYVAFAGSRHTHTHIIEIPCVVHVVCEDSVSGIALNFDILSVKYDIYLFLG